MSMMKTTAVIFVFLFSLSACQAKKTFHYVPPKENATVLSRSIAKETRFWVMSTLGNQAAVKKGLETKNYTVNALSFISYKLGQQAPVVLRKLGYKTVSTHYLPTGAPLLNARVNAVLSGKAKHYIQEKVGDNIDVIILISPPRYWHAAYTVVCHENEAILHLGFTVYIIDAGTYHLLARRQDMVQEALRSDAI